MKIDDHFVPLNKPSEGYPGSVGGFKEKGPVTIVSSFRYSPCLEVTCAKRKKHAILSRGV